MPVAEAPIEERYGERVVEEEGRLSFNGDKKVTRQWNIPYGHGFLYKFKRGIKSYFGLIYVLKHISMAASEVPTDGFKSVLKGDLK